jgi:hypothetical protein
MLAEQQLIEWFRNNGVDIGIPFPVPLVGRLCKKAISTDNNLFLFLSKSFKSHNKNLLVLKFTDWNEAFSCYSSYGVTSSPLKA